MIQDEVVMTRAPCLAPSKGALAFPVVAFVVVVVVSYKDEDAREA